MFSAPAASRRHFVRHRLALALGAAALACQMTSQAQTTGDAAVAGWPGKPVRLVAAFPPGGAVDILARGVGEVLQRETKQPFVVENRTGAGGNIGADNVAKSPADGYSILFSLDTTFTVNPLIYKSMPFKNGDLRPVMVFASQGMLMAVGPQTGIRTLDQFIARGKEKGLTLGSAGYGTPGHLAASILMHATGAKVNHVPYKGNAPATLAMLSGEVDGGVVSSTAMLPHVATGKITPLAVTSAKRNPLLPDVPSVDELGHKDLQQEVLFAAWVPGSMPEPLVQKIQAAFEKAMKDGPLRERMRVNDMAYEGLTGEAAARRIQALADRYRGLAQATGMKME